MTLAIDYPEDSPEFWQVKLKGFIEQGGSRDHQDVKSAALRLRVAEPYLQQFLIGKVPLTGPTKLKLLIANDYPLNVHTIVISMSPESRAPWTALLHNGYPEKRLSQKDIIAAYLQLKGECKKKTFTQLNSMLGIPESYRHTQTRMPPIGVASIYGLLLSLPDTTTLIDSMPTTDRDGYIKAMHWCKTFQDGTFDLLLSHESSRTIQGRLTSSIRLTREEHDCVTDKAKALGISKTEFMSRAIAYVVREDIQV